MKKTEQETEPKEMYAAILSNNNASIYRVNYNEYSANIERWSYGGDAVFVKFFKTYEEAYLGIRERFADLKSKLEESISKLEEVEPSNEDKA